MGLKLKGRHPTASCTCFGRALGTCLEATLAARIDFNGKRARAQQSRRDLVRDWGWLRREDERLDTAAKLHSDRAATL